MKKQVLLVILIAIVTIRLSAQTCTRPGQTPVSAIVVCGSAPFGQSNVASCGSSIIPTPCPNGGNYQNIDPYWYKLSCYASGTIGFTITPDNLNDNYDWQLFDKTSRNPVDVFTDPTMFVACNWSSDPGITGASVDGTDYMVCSGFGEPLFSKMPDLIAGHEYLLLISNHDRSQQGFQVLFDDGTAGITDGAPGISDARSNCDGTKVLVLLNKPMRCNTSAADGSDFTISGGATIVSATPLSCNPDGTMDSISILLASPLSGGLHTLTLQNGSDGNTLVDVCDRDIPANSNIVFGVAPLQPTFMDSLTTPGCGPKTLQLVFKRPIFCSSIASNGSDFVVSGPQTVTITGITSSCTGTNPSPMTSVINLQLASPISTNGVYQISLTTGSDGNTLIDECGRMTPPASLSFNIKEKASASFTYSLKTSCKSDTLAFQNDGLGGIISWNWSFDNITQSNLQNPIQIYPASGQHIIKLIVSNGACTDTVSKTISLNNKVVAAFEAPDMICPGDTIHFGNKTTGLVENWEWDFGNGIHSNTQSPLAQQYPFIGRETFYTIKLIASNISMNCKDSVTHRLRALSSCYIAVPTAFTPNGDGLNDYLYPLNALKADKLEFRVYNRIGQLVFETKDWTQKWDGRIKGILQNTGIYAWILSFTNHDTGEKVLLKGTSLLIR